jgi:hypothetical protein
MKLLLCSIKGSTLLQEDISLCFLKAKQAWLTTNLEALRKAAVLYLDKSCELRKPFPVLLHASEMAG